MATKFSPVTLRPLTGVLDRRSSVDESAPGAFREKLNLCINPDAKLARALGWLRAFPGVCYGNSDWHDQGVADADREPITMLFSSVANNGVRRLFLGTKTRIGLLNPTASFGDGKGDYTIIASGLGNDGSDSPTQTRFSVAELQNVVLFTNNVDRVKYYKLDNAEFGDVPTLDTVGEDANVNVSAARKIIQLGGILYLMNTVEGGTRFSSRIRWCDLNYPLFWKVGTNPTSTIDSIADFQDLDYGEEILNAVELAGSIWAYTDRAIWRCTPGVDASGNFSLNCVRVYSEPRNRAKCLAYPNTLVSNGFSMFYFGTDGIYEFNPYLSEPDRVEWIHRATTVIFKDAATRIDPRACNSPVAEYRPGINEDATAGDGELHFSWPIYDPPVELLPDPDPDCATYAPLDPVEDDGINSNTLVANIKHKTCDIRDYGVTAMVNHTSDVQTAGVCNRQSNLIAANGEDFALKWMDTGYGREMFVVESGEYELRGYFSLARGIFPFDKLESDKCIRRFLIECQALDPADVAVMRLRLGTSFEALDPNNDSEGKCRVLWHRLSDKPIRCRNTMTPEAYASKNLRPNDPTEWWFEYRGRLLYYEFQIANPDGSKPTSGGCTLSRLEVDARLV